VLEERRWKLGEVLNAELLQCSFTHKGLEDPLSVTDSLGKASPQTWTLETSSLGVRPRIILGRTSVFQRSPLLLIEHGEDRFGTIVAMVVHFGITADVVMMKRKKDSGGLLLYP
jgi:hypothetical protein